MKHCEELKGSGFANFSTIVLREELLHLKMYYVEKESDLEHNTEG